MAERKATNKYYPPEWTPNHGSLNKFHGSHPLRERARKIHQGIIGVRFELPFNIWCNGCGSHIGMGVRYNAEKSQVGKYYTTPIFKFRMKCHLCDNYFEIQNDPQNSDYVVTTGASRKNERWEHTEGETASIQAKEEKEKLSNDPMYKLEHSVEDKEKVNDETPRIEQLQQMQEEKKDDFTINQLLRKKFRIEKKEIETERERDRELQKRASIAIPLVPEDEKDIITAKKIKFSHQDASINKLKRRQKIRSQPIFGESSRNDRSKLLSARLRMSVRNDSVNTKTISSLRDQLGIQTKH